MLSKEEFVCLIRIIILLSRLQTLLIIYGHGKLQPQKIK